MSDEAGAAQSRVDRAARQFARLVEVMQTLRSPDGCPWDREQTWKSLGPFVLEETYEVLDAIDRNDANDLRQEVGDLLFEAVFLAQVGADQGQFDAGDALEGIVDKLVRRHPHVFARDGSALGPSTPREVEVRWEALKAAERAETNQPHSTMSGIARTLPALLRAYEIGQRAAAVGFDWTEPSDVLEKIREEVSELGEAVAASTPDARYAEEEMGDVLFAIANLSRKLGIEPEAALRKANDKFTRRFEQLESAIKAGGRTFGELTLDDIEREWQRIKAVERAKGG